VGAFFLSFFFVCGTKLRHLTPSNRGYKGCTTMMSLSLDEPRPIESRGRASPPGEASSGELSGE